MKKILFILISCISICISLNALSSTPKQYVLPIKEEFGIQNKKNTHIVIQAEQDVWVKITDEFQQVLFSLVLSPGDVYYMPDVNNLIGTFGDVSKTTIWIDGQRLNTKKHNRIDNVSMIPQVLKSVFGVIPYKKKSTTTQQKNNNFIEYSSLNHNKANGLDIRIKHPSTWLKKEGRRPHVVQIFSTNEEKTSCTLYIKQEENTLSKTEWASIYQKLTEADVTQIISTMYSNISNISISHTNFDSLSGLLITADLNAKQAGVTVYGKSIMGVFGYKNNTISIMCSAMGRLPQQAEKTYNNYYPTFMSIINSAIVTNLWNNPIEDNNLTDGLLSEDLQEKHQIAPTTKQQSNKNIYYRFTIYFLILSFFVVIFFVIRKKTTHNPISAKNNINKNIKKIEKNKKAVKRTLILFAILHSFFIALFSASNNVKPNMAPVFVQYALAWWIIRYQIDKKTKGDIIAYSWLVSIGIFVVSLILGYIFFGLIFNV